jgi:hypothetical protein
MIKIRLLNPKIDIFHSDELDSKKTFIKRNQEGGWNEITKKYVGLKMQGI